MSDQIANSSALYFPKELSIADSNCVVCMDDARKPVFCTTCKKLLCFDCMAKCQSENGCAICRSKAPMEVYLDQCDKFCCDKHALLLTMTCTDCNTCICKQCIGKDSEHALHAFRSIDDIRANLVLKIGTLNEYLDMADGIQTILEMASNIGVGNLQNMHSFGINQALVDNVRQFVTRIEAFKLEELIQSRIESTQHIEKFIGEIGKNTDQEPQDYYDFECFTSNLDLSTSSCHTLYSTKHQDKHGNVWEFQIFPKHKKMTQALTYLAFRVVLLSGTPGRYELKIDCDQPGISFKKVLEVALEVRSKMFQIWANVEEVNEMVLNIGIRPTNYRYHLQCARLYREIVDDPNRKDYTEKSLKMKKTCADFTKIHSSFITDSTGTIWRFTVHSFCDKGLRYFSADVEHYDGAVGRFDIYVKIENLNSDKKYTKNFTFGSKLHIKNLLAFPVDQFRFENYPQLKFGIRPSVQSSRVGFMARIFSK